MTPHTLEDFKQAADYLGSTPIFVLNILSDNLQSQLEMLRQAHHIDLPVQYIELGNELYFSTADFQNRYPTAGDYARAMNTWNDSLTVQFPDAGIAVAGVKVNDTEDNIAVPVSGLQSGAFFLQLRDAEGALLTKQFVK